MNNAFGHIPEDLLQEAKDAWEFKTCQRSDGTTYGTSGDCAQKGAKEVKKGSKKSSWDPGDNLSGKMGTEIAKVAGPPVTNPCPAGKRRMSSGRCVKAAGGTADRDITPKSLADRYAAYGLGPDGSKIGKMTSAATKSVGKGKSRKEAAAEKAQAAARKAEQVRAAARKAREAAKRNQASAERIRQMNQVGEREAQMHRQQRETPRKGNGIDGMSVLGMLQAWDDMGGNDDNNSVGTFGFGNRSINDPRGGIKQRSNNDGSVTCSDNTGSWRHQGSCY